MAGHGASHAASPSAGGDDKGWSKLRNGHEHPADQAASEKPTPEIQARLAQQLAITRSLVGKFGTVADAEAAGYRRNGAFLPGMGAHYSGGAVNKSGTLSDDEIGRPSGLLFGGTDKSSPLVGFFYISTFNGGKGPIQGFAGSDDKWHKHTGICFKVVGDERDVMGGDGEVSQEECEKAGATFRTFPNTMLHVWTVPGYNSSLGVFSSMNPSITCPDGTYHTVKKYRLNACRGQS